MRRQQRQISPIETYARHGNSIPSPERLEKMYGRLSSSNIDTTMLVVADMCLDLATQVPDELKDTWIDRAERHLDGVQEAGVALRENGLIDSHKKALPHIALATLRKSELANWRRAVHGFGVQEGYRDYLSATANLAPWIIQNPVINFRVIEFMPILIGARARHMDAFSGWFGRLALHREDKRMGNMRDHHTNWDTGISIWPNPQSFLKPPVKLQVKSRGGKGGVGDYQRSGVQMMIGQSVGIQDPLSVLTGLFIEAGIVSKDMVSSIHDKPAETEQLDEITGKMMDKIKAAENGMNR